jgi:hypothetical protein
MPTIYRITAVTTYDGLEFTHLLFTTKAPKNLQKFCEHMFLHQDTEEILTQWNRDIIESLADIL